VAETVWLGFYVADLTDLTSADGAVYGDHGRAAAHLTLRLPAKFALGALLEPLFGQFLSAIR
jgi:hypothetical protein